MSAFLRSGVWALLVVCLGGGVAWAANEGQGDLDRATQVMLNPRMRSDLGEAIQLLESALKKGLDEGNTQFAKQLLVSTRIRRGTLDSQEILKLPPDRNWPDIRRVALEDLEKAVAMDPKQPQALMLIAQLNFLPGGDAKRASQALDEAVQRSADQPQVQAKALAFRAGFIDDKVKKLKDLDEAVRVDPQQTAPLRARGSYYLDVKEYEKALADFEAALKLDEDNAAAWESKGIVLIDLKRYDDALAALTKAHELEPKAVTPLLQMARAHGLKTDYPAALADLEEAARVDPGNVAVLLLRASVYDEMKERDKALADIDRVLKLVPGLTEAMRLRAVILAGNGRFAEAITQLEKLQMAEPDDVDVAVQLGMFYTASQKPRKAVQLFDKILAKTPDNLHALRSRADALLSIGKQVEAIADYERALKLDPKDSGILNNLAWVLATSPDDKLRDGKRALDLATKAAELTKFEQGHILSTLAAAYAEIGDFESARKWSAKAVEIGKEEQKEQLAKELESYKANKPWREKQEIKEEAADSPEKPQDTKPADKPKPQKPADTERKTDV